MSASSRINKSTTKFIPKRRVVATPAQPAQSTLTLEAATPIVPDNDTPTQPTSSYSQSDDPTYESASLLYNSQHPTQPTQPTQPASSSSFAFTPRDPSLLAPKDPTVKSTSNYNIDPTLLPLAGPTASSSGAALAPQQKKKLAASLPAHLLPSSSNSFQNSHSITTDSPDGAGEEQTVVLIHSNSSAAAAKRREKDLAEGKVVVEKPARGKGKGKAGPVVQDGNEGTEEGTVEKSRTKPKPKPRARKLPVTAAPVVEEGADGPPPPPPKPKRARASAKSRAKKSTATAPKGKNGRKIVDGEEVAEGDDSDIEEPAMKRRKQVVGRAKATKTDLELFGEDDAEEEGEEGEEGDAMELDGEVAVKGSGKKGKLTRKEQALLPLPIVDSSSWTMAQLSTPRDIIGGRTSERFEDSQRRDQVAKDTRNARRKKMRDRATRVRKGLPEESEEEEAVQDVVEVKKKDEGTPRAEGSKSSAQKLAEKEDAIELERLNAIYPNEADSNLAGIQERRRVTDAEAAAVAGAVAAAPPPPPPPPGSEGGDNDEEFDDDGELVETQYAPQMRIVDGEMVLDDASLEVDRSKDARIGHVGPREVVEESARDRFVNSATWGKQKKTEKWTATETVKFYDLLRQFGTDFEMIARMYPKRTRLQIKNKWIKEEKINSAGITAALMERKKIDLVEYAKVTGANLSGPTPEDPYAKVQKLRAEQEAKERELGTKFGANGRDEVVESLPEASPSKARKGKGKNFVQPVVEEPEEEEEEEDEDNPENAALEAEINARIAQAAREEKAAARKRKDKSKGKGKEVVV